MASTDYAIREKKRSKIFFWSAVLLTVAAFVASYLLTGPAPPKQITIATGAPGGAYDDFGRQYKSRLEAMGLKVVLVNTNGAVDNLQRLMGGKVDVAFTQGGADKLVADPGNHLRALGAVYLEPVWVFSKVAGAKRLCDLQGHNLAIGPAGSGSEMVARQLLEAYGVAAEKSHLVNQTPAEAEKSLAGGTADALVMVSSPHNEIIQRLLRQPGIALMDFAGQEMALTRRFPFLRPVKLYPGIIDLENSLPAEEKTLLAAEALVVSKDRLHPQVVEQLFKAMSLIHSKGDLFSGPHSFPTLEGIDVAVHDTAEAYAKSGESFMAKVLPYWAVRLLWQLKVLLLPLIAVWIPAFKVLPKVYAFWAMRLIKRHYRQLRDLESAVNHSKTPDELQKSVDALEALRESMWGRSHRVPVFLQPNIYQWRIHVSEVCEAAEAKLKKLRAAAPTS